MKYLLLILLYSPLFSNTIFFEPNDEIIIELDASIESGDTLDLFIDNFTLFYPEQIELNDVYELEPVEFGHFRYISNENYSGSFSVKGLGLSGNVDTALVTIMNGLETIASIQLIDSSSNFNVSRFTKLRAFPNPSKKTDLIKIEFISDYSTKLEVSIYDLVGNRYVNVDYGNIEAGVTDLLLPLSINMANGYYIIAIEDKYTLYSIPHIVID